MEKTIREIIEMCKDIESICAQDYNIMDDLEIDYGWETLESDITILYEKAFDQWICWDTLVGKTVLFYRDIPVAITIRPFRKSNTEIYWLGEKQAEMVKKYMLTLLNDTEVVDNKNYVGMDTIIKLEGDDINNTRARMR